MRHYLRANIFACTAPVYYKIKSIVGERTKENRLEYQIDWEDDPETGEQFETSWEPKRFVTADAIEDWEWQKEEKESE